MTQYRVDASDIAGLGEVMRDLAQTLDSLDGLPRGAGPAYGTGQVASAMDDLLANWTHERLVLARSLAVLGDAANAAGAAYVNSDAAVAAAFSGGGRRLTGGPTT